MVQSTATPKNLPGITNGQDIKNIQGYAALTASRFGLTILSTAAPVTSRAVNADYALAKMKDLVKARRLAPKHGQQAAYMRYAALGGVTFIGSALIPAISGLVATNITTTGALINWADVVIPGYADVTYTCEITKADGSLVRTDSLLAVSQDTLTGLTTGTAYQARVKTFFNANKASTDWSGYVAFTTL